MTGNRHHANSIAVCLAAALEFRSNVLGLSRSHWRIRTSILSFILLKKGPLPVVLFRKRPVICLKGGCRLLVQTSYHLGVNHLLLKTVVKGAVQY